MIGREHLGITSIIRELELNPHWYETMLHFFRSNAWNLKMVTEWWTRLVARWGGILLENDMPIFVGDGVKQGKEARRMPGVKRLHQESETVSKSPYIFGHMFGAIGILVGNARKMFCVPLSMRIHDGDAQIRKWNSETEVEDSHVVRTIKDACAAAKALGRKSFLLLDRAFLSVPALTTLIMEETLAEMPLLSIVTRAKLNAVAYREPEPNKRGRPRKKGEKLKLKDLFSSHLHEFVETSATLYGKTEMVRYYCCDLLWGQRLYQKLRFVLVLSGDSMSIFVSTDLTLSPAQILKLYGYRFKIECSFREFKQVVAGFAYRFWSKYMPKLNRFSKSGYDPLEHVTDEKEKQRIIKTFNAIQCFVMMAAIAFGLLQICALRFAAEINAPKFRWLRSRSNDTPSEATTSHFMGKTIFRMIARRQDLDIMRFISERQDDTSKHSHVQDLPVGA
jgi:hypothetical protein